MKSNMNYFYTTKIDELYMRDRSYEIHLKKLSNIQKRVRYESSDQEQTLILQNVKDRRKDFDEGCFKNVKTHSTHDQTYSKQRKTIDKNSRNLIKEVQVRDYFKCKYMDKYRASMMILFFITRIFNAEKIRQSRQLKKTQRSLIVLQNCNLRLDQMTQIQMKTMINLKLEYKNFSSNPYQLAKQGTKYINIIRSREFPQLNQLSKEIFLHDSTFNKRNKSIKIKSNKLFDCILEKKDLSIASSVSQQRIFLNKLAILQDPQSAIENELQNTKESQENTFQNSSHLQNQNEIVSNDKLEISKTQREQASKANFQTNLDTQDQINSPNYKIEALLQKKSEDVQNNSNLDQKDPNIFKSIKFINKKKKQKSQNHSQIDKQSVKKSSDDGLEVSKQILPSVSTKSHSQQQKIYNKKKRESSYTQQKTTQGKPSLPDKISIDYFKSNQSMDQNMMVLSQEHSKTFFKKINSLQQSKKSRYHKQQIEVDKNDKNHYKTDQSIDSNKSDVNNNKQNLVLDISTHNPSQKFSSLANSPEFCQQNKKPIIQSFATFKVDSPGNLMGVKESQ